MHEWIYWLAAFLISAGFTLRIFATMSLDIGAAFGTIPIFLYWIAFLAFGLGRLSHGIF